jgi:hypothetical protein
MPLPSRERLQEIIRKNASEKAKAEAEQKKGKPHPSEEELPDEEEQPRTAAKKKFGEIGYVRPLSDEEKAETARMRQKYLESKARVASGMYRYIGTVPDDSEED